MCLAIPGEIVKMIEPDSALVAFGESRIKINLSFVEGVKLGDYVIAHSGFALSVLDEEEAIAQLALWEEYREKMAE